MKLSHPLKGSPRISGGFGPRQSFQLPNGLWTLPFHYGTDWAVAQGTPIYAAHDGTARTVGWDHSPYGGGWWVQIVNGNYSTWYLHMREQSPIRQGSHVRRGQLIGYVGSTGASTGPHLHMEFHINGIAVDPVPYITQHSTEPEHNRPPFIHPVIDEEDGEEEMKLWIADVNGTWYLIVPTGAGKPNAAILPGNSGMGGGGAARAGIPVVRMSKAELRKVANV